MKVVNNWDIDAPKKNPALFQKNIIKIVSDNYKKPNLFSDLLQAFLFSMPEGWLLQEEQEKCSFGLDLICM